MHTIQTHTSHVSEMASVKDLYIHLSCKQTSAFRCTVSSWFYFIVFMQHYLRSVSILSTAPSSRMTNLKLLLNFILQCLHLHNALKIKVLKTQGRKNPRKLAWEGPLKDLLERTSTLCSLTVHLFPDSNLDSHHSRAHSGRHLQTFANKT